MIENFDGGNPAIQKALLSGKLQIALEILRNSSIVQSIEDYELLMESIKLPKIVRPVKALYVEAADEDEDDETVSIGSSISFPLDVFDSPSSSFSLMSWGSNCNFMLGNGLADSRTYPEQVRLSNKISQIIPFHALLEQDPQIMQIAMSKYHVAVVTKNHLYSYGFGTGGRLGLGNNDTAVLPCIVEGIERNVVSVALGPDHSLALTEDGRIFSWGSNKRSQLGYSSTAKDCNLSPQEVTFRNTAFAVGAACSKFHSAVFTNTGSVFTWGTNNGGCLGYDRDVQLYPRKVTSFPTQRILQIAATDRSTIVLVATNQVHVFMNGAITRLVFRTSLGPTINRIQAFPMRINGSEDNVGIVLSNGDVFIWSSDVDFSAHPRIAWRTRNRNRVATDVAIGANSSVVICTLSGHVFTGLKRNAEKENDRDGNNYRFSQVANLEHCIFVVASSSGSFSAIRSDFRFPPAIDMVPSFGLDLKKVLDGERTDYDFLFIVEGGEIIPAHSAMLSSRSFWLQTLLFSNHSVTHSDWQYDVEEKNPKLTLNGISGAALRLAIEFAYTGIFRNADKKKFFGSYKDQSPVSRKICTDFKKLVKLFLFDETEVLQSSISSSNFAGNFATLDLLDAEEFENVVIDLQDGSLKSYSFILSSRCTFFSAILGTPSRWTLPSRDGLFVVDMNHTTVEVFGIILKWINTDSPDLFESISKESFNSWISLIKSVQILADELLIKQIVNICSVMLARFISINTAIDYLTHAVRYNAICLEEACLDFILRNMETFLKRGYLQELDEELLILIECKLQKLQIDKISTISESSDYQDSLQKRSDTGLHRNASSSSFTPLNSPFIKGLTANQFMVSPLLMPLHGSYPVSPLLNSANTCDIPSSMEEFSLGSSWIESKSRRRNSLKTMEIKKPTIACSASPTRNVVGASPKLAASPLIGTTSSPIFISDVSSFSDKINSTNEPKKSKLVIQIHRIDSSLKPLGNSSLLSAQLTPTKKLSQKERKRLAQSPAPPTIEVVQTPPKRWGTTNNIPVTIQNIVEQEEMERMQSQPFGRSSSDHTLYPPSSNLKATVLNPTKPLSFLSIQTAQKEKIQPFSLLSIQSEQSAQRVKMQRSMNKSLSQIQKEETAMTELAKYYKETQTEGTGEWVTIRRI